jgi:metallo-beta-lactamase family protein
MARLDGLSGHADRSELLDWLGATPVAPRRTFLVHGEPAESDAFRRAAQESLGLNVQVAEDGRTVSLE